LYDGKHGPTCAKKQQVSPLSPDSRWAMSISAVFFALRITGQHFPGRVLCCLFHTNRSCQPGKLIGDRNPRCRSRTFLCGCIHSGPYVWKLCVCTAPMATFRRAYSRVRCEGLALEQAWKPLHDTPKTRHRTVTGYSGRNVFMTAYSAASSVRRTLPLSCDIAQLACLGLKLKHRAAPRGYVG
jgi:hypothetical protein